MEKPPPPPPNPALARYIRFRMRCGKVIIVLNTPQARENARRQGWTEVK